MSNNTQHDPLCPSTDATESEYCALCHCDLIAKVREDMLAKCIAAVEFLHDNNSDQASAFWYAICELRALQEKS